jgi:transmembrane sensor
MDGNFKGDEILLKCLQGKANDHEYEAAYIWINSEPANQEYYRQIQDAWIAAEIITSKNQYDCQMAWKRIAHRTGIKLFDFPKINSTWSKIAAFFIISFALGAFSYHYFIVPKELFKERDFIVQSPLGSKSYMVLPDSSKVWLNAGSTLSYSTHYDVSQRSVHLIGEAYFDVKTNDRLPFRVYAADLVINAFGTEFNVKAYPEERYVETTLVSGLVTLERTDENFEMEKIILKPNQRASMVRGEARIDISKVAKGTQEGKGIKVTTELSKQNPDKIPEKIVVRNVFRTEVFTSWKDKRLIFDSEKMADLAVKLERIYDVKISFEDEELKNYRLTGTLEQETIEELLYAIRLAIPMDFQIKNRNVVFTLNKELQKKYKDFEK